MYKTANPALNENTFKNVHATGTEFMTIDGVVNKCFLLFIVLLFPSFYTWNLFLQGSELVFPLMIVGAVGGLITAIITVFKKEWASKTAIIYVAFQGLFIGGFSSFLESLYPGIVIQAIALTLGVMLMMLFLYKAKIIKVTENFKLGIVAATGAIFIIYLVSFVLSFFGVSVPLIHSNGLIGIGFSLFVVGIAAMNLVLDFDFVEHGAEQRAPKYMEWYAAFGLMVTLVWLYIEILRLLSKLRSRN